MLINTHKNGPTRNRMYGAHFIDSFHYSCLVAPVAKRSYSKLKLIKTFLHPSITEDTQDRLEDLALISIEYEIAASLDWWIGAAGVYHCQDYKKAWKQVILVVSIVSILSMLRNTQEKNAFIKEFFLNPFTMQAVFVTLKVQKLQSGWGSAPDPDGPYPGPRPSPPNPGSAPAMQY